MSEALLAQIATLRGRLLDTTTRNRLLNYPHPGRGCARFVETTLDGAFAPLSAGRSLTIEPIPEPSPREVADYWRAQGKDDANDKVPAERWARHLRINPDFELARSTSNAGQRLLTLQYRTGQEVLLRRLRSAARSAIEESGANLLFLAFGFLQWRDGGEAGRSCLAPLLLVPVELEVGRSRSGQAVFRLNATGEDIQSNYSLARKLGVDHGLKLPQPALGEEELSERPESYLARVQDAVRDLPGWTVRPYLTLGLFDFGSFLLWRDLDPAVWPPGSALPNRPLIRQLIGAEPADAVTQLSEPRDLDEHIDLNLALVDRANGSQARALVRAIAGETMLIEGPPGTGKSQTITNLIAVALEQGKRVLFVSEKLAALDVVRRRMDALGLGEFCLELHSEKARNRALLDDIERCLKRRAASPLPSYAATLAQLRAARAELAAYGEALLATAPGSDEPVFRTLSRAAVLREKAREAGLVQPLGHLRLELASTDHAARAAVRQKLEAIGRSMTALDGPARQHPWAGIDGTTVQPFEREQVVAQLRRLWADSVRAVEALRDRCEATFGGVRVMGRRRQKTAETSPKR
jgi:hypothetical protein